MMHVMMHNLKGIWLLVLIKLTDKNFWFIKCLKPSQLQRYIVLFDLVFYSLLVSMMYCIFVHLTSVESQKTPLFYWFHKNFRYPIMAFQLIFLIKTSHQTRARSGGTSGTSHKHPDLYYFLGNSGSNCITYTIANHHTNPFWSNNKDFSMFCNFFCCFFCETIKTSLMYLINPYIGLKQLPEGNMVRKSNV